MLLKGIDWRNRDKIEFHVTIISIPFGGLIAHYLDITILVVTLYVVVGLLVKIEYVKERFWHGFFGVLLVFPLYFWASEAYPFNSAYQNIFAVFYTFLLACSFRYLYPYKYRSI